MNSEEEKAILSAQTAVKNNPADFELYVELGMAHFHAGQLAEALAAFRQAIVLNPNVASAYNGIGRVHYHTGPAQAAIEAYEHAIALDPHQIDRTPLLRLRAASALWCFVSVMFIGLAVLTPRPFTSVCGACRSKK